METTIEVSEQSQVAEVRRIVSELGRAHGMSEDDVGRACLVATEAATNLVKYARGGVVAASWFEEGGAAGIQMISLDRGPGFANFVQASRDGFSTGGSLGIGLGAIMRGADEFEVFTVEAEGSAMLMRVGVRRTKPKLASGAFWVGSRGLPKPGQEVSGDAWAFKSFGAVQRLCLVDGLGHGPLAAIAASEATRVLHGASATSTPAEIIQQAHAALKTTRGAVMAVLVIDLEKGAASFAGIGNIAGVIFNHDKPQHLMSGDGTVGYNIRNLRQHEYPWNSNSVLVLNTDGLSSRWNLNKLPGLLQKHPALVAAVLHRDHGRNSDDATVVVARVHP